MPISEELAAQIAADYPHIGCKASAEKYGVNRQYLSYWASKHGIRYQGPLLRSFRKPQPDPTPEEIQMRAAEIRAGWKYE